MNDANRDTQFESLSADCQRALLTQTSRLTGEPLDAADVAWFDAHLQTCAQCRALLDSVAQSDRAVRSAFSTVRVSNTFVANALAALPASAPTPVSAPAAQMRVYASAAKSKSWDWSRIAAAAAVVLVIGGLSYGVTRILQQPVSALSLQKGKLVDEHGAAVNKMVAGRVCQAQEDTVLRGNHEELVSVRKGAHFKLSGEDAATPEVHLEDGDLYASATEASPVRMGCANFDAELSNGDCFLAQETSAIPQSVMILFEGNARITPRLREPVRLSSGQIFVSVGSADDAYTDTLELTNYTEGRVQEPPSNIDAAEMRRRYERQVEGYRAELVALNARITALPATDPAVADLHDRCVRIQSYLRAHEVRLQSLPKTNHPVTLPLDCIERGLKEHHDPKTWM